MFGILFFWQLPHFLAIAWLYRADYARAGLKMLPAMPGGEPATGRSASFHALVLLLVSLAPAFVGLAGGVYVAGVVLAGLAYLAAALRFAWRADVWSARLLLVVSLVYLPAVFGCVFADPIVRAHLFGGA